METIDIGGNIKDYIYAYDNYDQLNLAQTPNGTYSYTFDERNNRLTQRIVKDDSDITEYYTYDLEDRLTNLKVRDTQSQELIKEVNYLYDNNGNLINKTIFTGGGAQTYHYSYYVGGNLKSVILPDESQIQFTYYAGGLRANKTTNTEIITYHYQGGTISKEVHKDKVTGEVIKTIRYIPYGIKIEQGGTETIYFYVTDMRGSVIALTGEEGYIVETYSYDPFGNLLSTPTIYNPKLYIGRDDVLYDTETDLYYMHARYYDPEAGRFIMKDPVEGSLSNPITQNSYIYCANDPVNKIDPGGTVTQGALDNPFKPQPRDPPSKPPCPVNCIPRQKLGLLGSGFECIVGDCSIDEFVDISSNTSDDPTSASTVLGGGLGSFTDTIHPLSRGIPAPDSGIIEQPNKDYNIKWEMDENGNVKLSAVDKAGNPVELSPEDQAILDSLQNGINDALKWLGTQKNAKGEGFKFNDLAASKKEIMNFISKYSSMFYHITGGETPENAYELAYNATVGLAIASQMQRYNNKNYNKYDQEIGFWVSFWSRRSEIKMEFKSKDINKTLGLVDLANLVKAISYQETHVGTNKDTNTLNDFNMGGIMQVEYGIKYQFETSWAAKYGRGLKFYNKGEEFFNIFNNIGIGVGQLFAKLTIYSDYPYNSEGARNSPSTEHWFQAVRAYGPHNNGKPDSDYWTNIRDILFSGYSSRDKERLFDPKKYYP